MKSHRIERSFAAAGVLALLTIPASAQTSDRAIREELDFARGLASEWQFVGLAEKVLGGIDAGRASDRLKEEIVLAQCEVYASAARGERSDGRRQELYEKALEAYRDYLDKNRFAENRGDAERALVDLARAYGQDLFDLHGEAVGSEAESLGTKIQGVLTDAIQRTADLVDALKLEIQEANQEGSATALTEREYYELLINRGRMFLVLALVSGDGAYYFEKAIETLEETAGEAGETTFTGLEAYLLLGQVYSAQGEYGEASSFVQYVVDSTIPIDPAARAERFAPLPPATKEVHWYFVDRATGALVDAHRNAGDVATACAYGLHFLNLVDEYGFAVSRPQGYLSMLSVARALLDSGGYVGGASGSLVWYPTRKEMEDLQQKKSNRRTALDVALQMAQQVNRDNRGNTLQLAAQKVISEVIARGVSVDPEVLFEAAQGAYLENDLPTAIEGFKRVLSVLESGDPATRTRLGPGVLWHIGRSYQKLGRVLEGAMAFRAALDARWQGDPQYDGKNAQHYHASVQTLKNKAGSDPLVESMYRESQDLVLRFAKEAGDTGDILYRQAELAYAEEDYARARDLFLQVTGSATGYEKAVVYAAVCQKKLGNPQGALADLERYLESYVTDPVYQPTTESAKVARREAMGLATYWAGLIEFDAAEKGTGDYRNVVETLDKYITSFPNQGEFGPKTLLMVVQSLVALGDVPAAEQRFDILEREFRDNVWTGQAAYQLYKVYSAQRAAVKPGSDEYLPLTRAMAQNLGRYNENNRGTKLNNLRIEGNLWLECEDWVEAERVLSRAVSEFAAEGDPAMQTTVLPDLAHAKLELRKIREAADILRPLAGDPASKPSKQAARDLCRATTGWLEGSGKDIVAVPGIADESTLKRAVEILLQLTKSGEDKWSCKGYELRFELAYAIYLLGQFDGTQLAGAKNVISQLQSDLAAPGLEPIASACGNEDLRQRFLWLLAKL